MIDCHPLLQPIVHLAKPIVHAVRHWHPHRHIVGARHHVHHATRRIVTAVRPSPAVMIVCHRVAAPLVAGGLAFLPPSSGVPGTGGVGGFPGAVFPEYGAPAFAGPGYIGAGPFTGPGAYGPGGYSPTPVGLLAGPAVLGPGSGGSRALAPGAAGSPSASSVPSSSAIPLLASSGDTTTPLVFAQTLGTSVPETASGTPASAPSAQSPLTVRRFDDAKAAPAVPAESPLTQPSQTPGGPVGTKPGEQSPADATPTPEPATLALLATALGVTALLTHRRRRSTPR